MVRTQPLDWSKCLLFYAYSLWFMQLPSMLAVSKNKKKVLRLAFHVLSRIESTEIFPLDQVCYRILIEMCGQEGEPALAVKVLKSMRRTGLEQNAVTYGIYHRAVMKAQWPTVTRQRASDTWRKLRLIIVSLSQFRNGRTFAGQIQGVQTQIDSILASDNGYYSKRPSEKDHPHITVQLGDDAEEQRKLETEPYVISYHALTPVNSDPLLGSDSDPLGAANMKIEEKESGKPNQLAASTMSPSRARFLQEHSSNSLFTQEETPKPEKEKKSGGGWFRGLSNSPIIKMIRNQTLDNTDRKSSSDGGSDLSAMSVSPSLQSLVTQVKKGYDEVLKDGGVSRFRLGVSSLVQEVKSLNRSYGTMGSGQLFGEEDDVAACDLNENDPAFQLDSGTTGDILGEQFWTKGLFEENNEEGSSRILEVNLSSCTQCSNCKVMIYDEEIMAGWKVEDQNLNTECPYCYIGSLDNKGNPGTGIFAPRLHIQYKWKDDCRTSWYTPSEMVNRDEACNSSSTNSEISLPSDLSVAFLSPLVLRRELETLLAQDILALKDRSLKDSHPFIFWNLLYYLRRLSLPSHLLGWLGDRCHIRCVYDRPLAHQEGFPLYLSNPSNVNRGIDGSSNARSLAVWRQVTGAVGENNMFKAIQALVNESRRVTTQGVALGRHFPIFRDIQFSSLDAYGRALNRSNVDDAYQREYERLPPRILPLLPVQDYPQKVVHRACRMVFQPLDLY